MMDEDIQQLEKKLEAVEKELNDAKEIISQLEDEKTALNEENGQVREENQYLKDQLNKALAELKQMGKKNQSLKDQLNNALAENEKKNQKKQSFAKPNVKKKRGKKRGAKKGHKGHYRPIPDHIDEELDHDFDFCPDCRTWLGDQEGEVVSHYEEDIEPKRQYHVTEHKIHRKWCPTCKKKVSVKPLTVLPLWRFGLTLMLFVCFQKQALGLPYNKIAFELYTYFGIKVSEGEVYLINKKVAELFGDKYEELRQEMRRMKKNEAAYIDETGWRINGKNHWLWAYIARKLGIALYQIAKSRGHKVPQRMLGKNYRGVAVNDFYLAYNPLNWKKQKCWAHLLRETHDLSEKKNASEDIKQFHKKCKRLYNDAVRFKDRIKDEKIDGDEKQRRLLRFKKRLKEIYEDKYSDPDCKRLANRFHKHRDEMFVFVEVDDVDPDNNEAERGIKPNIRIRKISGGSRSKEGADAHAVNMSIIETFKRRDLDFFEASSEYIKNKIVSGEC